MKKNRILVFLMPFILVVLMLTLATGCNSGEDKVTLVEVLE